MGKLESLRDQIQSIEDNDSKSSSDHSEGVFEQPFEMS